MMKKINIVLEIMALVAGITMLCCLMYGAVLCAGLFMWLSCVLGGISMWNESRIIAANHVVPIKSLHDYD